MPKSDGKGNCQSDEALDGVTADELMIHEDTCGMNLSALFEGLMSNVKVEAATN